SARSGGKAIPGGLPDTSGAGGQGCLSLRRCGGGSSGAEGPARQAHLAVRRWRAGLRLHSRRRRRPVYRRHPAGDPGQGPAAVSGGDSAGGTPSGPLHGLRRHPYSGVQPAGPVRQIDNSRRERSL
ncbi:DUF551 domain-containing protein, partial [Dysosmobacter welbionis]